MKTKDIKKRFQKIMSNATPEVLDKILKNCNEKERVIYKMEKKEKNNSFNIFKMFKVVAAVATVLVLCMIGVKNYQSTEIESIVALDVNPSIELQLNKEEKVLSVKAINPEGKNILKGMNLENVELETAINAVIGSMVKNSYLNEIKNSILVSVESEDAQKGKVLQEKVSNEIDKALKNNLIEGAILSQNYNKKDEKSKLEGVSVGKARLIQEILDAGVKDKNNQLITFEELSKLSINELNIMANTKKVDFKGISAKGIASQKAYIGEEKAKQIAFTHSKENATNAKQIRVEMEFENGKFVYEVEFLIGAYEYEYEVDAITGEITEAERENDKTGKEEVLVEEKMSEEEKRLKEEEAKIEAEKKKLDQEEEKIEKEEKEIENKKLALKQDEKSIKQEIAKVEEKVETLEDNLEDIPEDEKENLKQQIKTLKEEIKRLEQQEEGLKVRKHELEQQEKALEAREEELERQENILDEKEREIERQIKELNKN